MTMQAISVVKEKIKALRYYQQAFSALFFFILGTKYFNSIWFKRVGNTHSRIHGSLFVLLNFYHSLIDNSRVRIIGWGGAIRPSCTYMNKKCKHFRNCKSVRNIFVCADLQFLYLRYLRHFFEPLIYFFFHWKDKHSRGWYRDVCHIPNFFFNWHIFNKLFNSGHQWLLVILLKIFNVSV